MADPTEPVVETQATAAAPSAVPANDASATAVESSATPAATETAAAEAPAAAEPIKTILGDLDAASDKLAEGGDPAKPVDAAKPADGAEAPKPADAGTPEAVAQEIAFEFQWPELLQKDDAKVGAFTDALKELRNPDAPTAQAAAQKLLDMHVDALKTFATQYAQDAQAASREAWGNVQTDWRNRVMGDPELGGAGHDTSIKACARMRDMLVSSAKPGTPRYEREMREFQEFDQMTGASNHPALLRILHNAARLLDEPQAENLPTEIKPSKTNGRAPKSSMYTHPTSEGLK